MTYIPSTWSENDLLTPGKMNNIEQGIANVSEKADISILSDAEIDEIMGATVGDPQEVNFDKVTSFNRRVGAVMPQVGDYTAEMIGAASIEEVQSVVEAETTQCKAYTDKKLSAMQESLEEHVHTTIANRAIPSTVVSEIVLTTEDGYDGMQEHSATTLYLIKEEG